MEVTAFTEQVQDRFLLYLDELDQTIKYSPKHISPQHMNRFMHKLRVAIVEGEKVLDETMEKLNEVMPEF